MNLIPDRNYFVFVTVVFHNNKTVIKRPQSVTTKKVSNATSENKSDNKSDNGDKYKSNNTGGIIAGVISSVAVITTVTIALISVWLINRRRTQVNRSGPHYISVVSSIGNNSTQGKSRLQSRPGYLPIVHDHFQYEIPRSTINSSTALFLTEGEYPKQELRTGRANSSASINSVLVTTEPIHTASISSTVTDLDINDAQIAEGKKKLVKPYAVVNVTDIVAKYGLETGRGVLHKHKMKQHIQKQLPSNREALEKSFALCCDSSSLKPAEQCHSSISLTGRYYTVPVYVNVNVPMTVNPSYIKNKV